MSRTLIKQAVAARHALLMMSEDSKKSLLMDAADALLGHQEEILSANSRDLSRMDASDPKYDRLQLSASRLAAMADDMRKVASLPSPLEQTLSDVVRPNGMRIRKVTVPFGVVGIIYEARPNVTTDVFSLCLKAGNVCLLKGGADAEDSNRSIVDLLCQTLRRHGVDPAVCTLLPSDRASADELLRSVGLVDLVIPRGSAALIDYVRRHALVPVIETGAGVCHAYFDQYGDLEKGRLLVENAKTRRVSVCNALDCLLVHRDRLSDLPELCRLLSAHDVVIAGDPPALRALSGHYPTALLQSTTEQSYGTEFLDYKMSIRTVSSIEEALAHIERYSSKHSECIISESEEMIRLFEQWVDAACVYVNVSTAFTDGGEFGLGAEIGISTQKLHARGPMGLQELTTYKYIIEGTGQIRK